MADAPLISVITTLLYPRVEPLRCLASWTAGQKNVPGGIELLVVDNGRRRALARQLTPQLRPDDRMLFLDSSNEMELYDHGARQARGTWLMFTEPHCQAQPECLAELLQHIEHTGDAGACVRTLPTEEVSRVARMEARMYLADAELWTAPDNWRKFTKRGFFLRRSAYESVGGLDFHRLRYAEITLAAKLHDAGHRLGFAPQAAITHYNSPHLGELLGYVWEYRRQELRAAADPHPAIARSASVAADPDLIEAAALPALRHRWPRLLRKPLQRICDSPERADWQAALTPLQRLAAPTPPVARLRQKLTTITAPLSDLFSAGLAFTRRLQDDDTLYQAYLRIWQRFGDLSVAIQQFGGGATLRLRPHPRVSYLPFADLPACHLAGFHELEDWQGHTFRWSACASLIALEKGSPPQRVTLHLAPARSLHLRDVFLFWNDQRLSADKAASTSTAWVFDLPTERSTSSATDSDFLTLIVPPVTPGHPADPRALGLPIVAIALD